MSDSAILIALLPNSVTSTHSLMSNGVVKDIEEKYILEGF